MKIIIQRVSKAKVEVKGKVVGEIGKGLFVLLGIKKGDSKKEVDFLVEKLVKLRVMADEKGKMNLTVANDGGSFLIVSQFTLYADVSGGNRPSFINAEDPVKAKALYEYFIEELQKKGVKIETGSFGEYMGIEALLDGPVTILLES